MVERGLKLTWILLKSCKILLYVEVLNIFVCLFSSTSAIDKCDDCTQRMLPVLQHEAFFNHIARKPSKGVMLM